MTATHEQIRQWLKREASRTGPEKHSLRGFEMALHALKEPALLKGLSDRARDNVTWRIGWMISCGSPSRDNQSFRSAAVALVEAAPGFLTAVYGAGEEENEALEMFWDAALNLPDSQRVAEICEAAFAALTSQLEHSNRWVQHSALHGFGHLKDPRSRPLIRKFIEGCSDPALNDYATLAMTFTLM